MVVYLDNNEGQGVLKNDTTNTFRFESEFGKNYSFYITADDPINTSGGTQAVWNLLPASQSGVINIDCGDQGSLNLNAGDVLINNKEAATIDDIENLSLSVTKQTFFSLNLNSLVSQLAAGTGYKTVTISVGNSPFPIGSKYLAVSEKFLGYIQGLSSRVFSMVYVNGTTGSVGTVSIISLSQGFVSDVSLSK